MNSLVTTGFSELTEKEYNDVNGGFAFVVFGFKITGALVAKQAGKFAAKYAAGKVFTYCWERLNGQR